MDTGYLSKGTLFPYCPYGGCSPEEARRGYTYILKRRDEYERKGGWEAAKKRFLRRQAKNG
jgi:hypothetical protein